VFLILALVLFFAVPWPWNLIGGLIALVVFVGELGFWHRRVRTLPKKIGGHTLIGAEGVVVTACRPKGQARIDGTIWKAKCAAGADAGEAVIVTERHGLTLTVRRADEPDEAAV
jgi:membrane protein implicated in regulation of membrane protease activity